MLPTFAPSDKLSRFLSDRAQRISDAESTLRREGFDTDSLGYQGLSLRVLNLFDAAVFAAES